MQKEKIAGKNTTIPLQDVLLVFEIKQNLPSISQLTNDYPSYFEFTDDAFQIKDRRTNQILALGIKRGGLCALEESVVKANFSYCFQTASEEVWHQRAKILYHLRSSGFISVVKNRTSDICASCQFK